MGIKIKITEDKKLGDNNMEYGLKEKSILEFIKREGVFSISFLLATISCFFYIPKLSFINFKVLSVLFCLMVIIGAMKEFKVLDFISTSILQSFREERKVSLVLVTAVFICSMFITNDVALLTFVPLTIITAKKSNIDPMYTVILETIAANVGSSLTPFGNPQNLYIFSHYNLESLMFFKITGGFVFLGAVTLYLMNFKVSKTKLSFSIAREKIEDKKGMIFYGILFFLTILSVFSMINYEMVFVIILIFTYYYKKELFKAVDYPLLGTFIFFFIFIGNISHLPLISVLMKTMLKGRYHTYLASIIFSQFISNVPCAILISGFSNNIKELLLGVNIGGMGTLISSLASVISYKIYNEEYENKKYLFKFHSINFMFLIIFTLFFISVV